MASYRGLHVGKVSLLAVGFAAAVIGKWQLAGDGEVWDWLFTLLIGCIVIAQVLEITERLIRRRRGAGHDEVNSVDPRSGPPGWRWDPARSTWRPPDV